MKIEELLKLYQLHDSGLYSIRTTWDGNLILEIDLDEVWNKEKLKEIIFKSTYEVSEFKIDRLNVIGGIQYTELTDYDRSFITTEIIGEDETIMVSIDFVAGGSLVIIAENNIEIKKEKV